MVRAYLEAIHLIKKDQPFAERVFAKWFRESDSVLVRKTVEVYARLFKSVPNVPDRGIESVLSDLSLRRPVPKELLGNPEYFRDNGPLEKIVKEGWIDQLYR